MRMRRINLHAFLLATGIILAVVPRMFAQHEVTADDVREGERLFAATCTGCHGAEGDGVFGVDLGRGQFRNSSTDEDLIRTIKNGLPGTAMPPSNFTDAQAENIVAYLRSRVSTPIAMVPGDANRGKALFEGKGKCVTCHRVNGNGSRIGPDLSEIGELRKVPDLERALIDPGAEILPANRSFRVVTRDGVTTTGRLLNHDSFVVLMIDSQERLKSFAKANLREYGFVETSPMPSYRDTLSTDERTDVIRYLAGLRGVKADKPR
jgi:putative heme-binding domain-containing protein